MAFSHFQGNNGRTLCGKVIRNRIPTVNIVDDVTCKVCDRVIAAASRQCVTGRVAHVVTHRAGNVAAVHADLIARLKADAESLKADRNTFRWLESAEEGGSTWRWEQDVAADIEALIKIVEERL